MEETQSYAHPLVPTAQISVARSWQADMVDGIYKIHTNQPVNELSNEFCRYFKAQSLEDELEYFAIVFHSHFNPHMRTIEALKVNPIAHLNNIITYAIVRLSELKSTNLVVIVNKYDISNNLATHIENHGPLFIEQIEQKLVPQLSKLLAQCQKININCGNINPHNILIDQDNNFILREFINTYPGFEQLNHYLAPEITECVPVGRNIANLSVDIYALGISVFYCLTGHQPWTDYESADKYNAARFASGTFKLLMGSARAEYFKVFLKGTVHDSAHLRWGVKDIAAWLAGNILKLSLAETISDNVSQLAFQGGNYSNLKSLAYALFTNWDAALSFICDNKLLRWLAPVLSKEQIAEITALIGNKQAPKNQLFVFTGDSNSKLIQLLMLIDKEGAIRQHKLAVCALSIPNALHYFLVKHQQIPTALLMNILSKQYWKTGQAGYLAASIDEYSAVTFKEVIGIYKESSALFGIERVVYSLNESAPCLSPVVAGDYIISAQDLLIALDGYAAKIPDKFYIDRHIIAFIAAKLAIRSEAPIKILANFPKFTDHPLIQGLCVLGVVQSHYPETKTPSLSNVLTGKIIALFMEYLHNVKFKVQISQLLTAAATSGDLAKVVKILTNTTPFIEDYNGYYQAVKETQRLKAQIATLTIDDKMYERTLLLGQKLTVLLSYILCLLVTVILVI